MEAKRIARALATVAAGLELATSDQMDPDFAVELLEQIGSHLSMASEEELSALEVASAELAEESDAAGSGFQAASAFYRAFPRGFLGE